MSITASLVNDLRNKTGAGMMDCKKALEQTGGDIEKAIEYLRKRGVQQAEKKVGRSANQGIIQSYIHPGSRLGVLVEINCETDFVARTPDFQEFAKDVAMQIAAANPLVVDRSELDQQKIDKELEIYRDQAREQGKPEAILDKIAQGKLEKYYQEVCLLEQSFVKDPNKTIRDLLNEKIAKLGENMILRRFVRFQLGE
ncbi:MAG TPA: translation elongation factor Ts [bacterium]|nr:translation elongation factor Ts [bacterium]HOY45150.1 translation elongation factor Ts [bacterium]HPG84486.1 translation elongation factor Ts [bacterium]HPM60619.1 translation elongation factor Ts [bacterium]